MLFRSPRASVEHAYRRVFGGPYVARNKVQVGRLEQLWEGEVSTNPNEKLYRSLLGGKVDRQESTSDIVLSQQVRLGRAQDTQRTERLYFVQAERGSRVVKDTGNKVDAVALSVNAQGVWRQLDSVVLPTEGFSLSAQGGLGRAQVGIDRGRLVDRPGPLVNGGDLAQQGHGLPLLPLLLQKIGQVVHGRQGLPAMPGSPGDGLLVQRDRKSTRLNSSHSSVSRMPSSA